MSIYSRKLPDHVVRSECVMVRMTKGDKELLEGAAELDGLSLGSELLHAFHCYLDACEEEDV